MFRQFKDSSYLNCAEAEQTGGSRVNMVGGAAAGPASPAAGPAAPAEATAASSTASSTETAGPAAATPESEFSNYTTALISIINSILSEPNGIELANQVKNELSDLKSDSVISKENA